MGQCDHDTLMGQCDHVASVPGPAPTDCRRQGGHILASPGQAVLQTTQNRSFMSVLLSAAKLFEIHTGICLPEASFFSMLLGLSPNESRCSMRPDD